MSQKLLGHFCFIHNFSLSSHKKKQKKYIIYEKDTFRSTRSLLWSALM